jgi:diguanylate cyclase (GGDEF)-like protein/PAS domain S-box-containing protein
MQMMNSCQQHATPSYTSQMALSIGVVALAIGTSFFFSWQAADARMQSVARERGAALFRLVQITRSWNAAHGGVYVPVSADTQPNPYLEHPRRDLVTQDGMALTMVNPAFMTRQISEIAAKAQGFHFHITSNKPIRPDNKPDTWESETLAQFETGLLERIDLNTETQTVHRYMAPLKVEPACMKCHQKQGYVVGQIRGGISIDMPANELLAMRTNERTRSAMGHLLAFVVMSALVILLMSRTRKHTLALENINRNQDQLIAQRTAQLSEANATLASQVAEREVAATVFEHTSQAIMVLDASTNIDKVNPAFTAITGYLPGVALGLTLEAISTDHHDPVFFENLRQVLAQTGHWSGEFWSRRNQAETFVSWLSITVVPGEGINRSYVATLSDITERKAIEVELRHLAHHDPLTGLPNRALFTDRIQMALAQSARQHRQFALFMVDLDHFKKINDSLGHGAGDRLLMEASDRLRRCVRDSDTVARVGGDEFAIILTEFTSMQEVEAIANRVVHALSQAFHLGTSDSHISCSIGIAIYPQHGDTAESLALHADTALYQVKEGARNGYSIAIKP